MENTKLYDVEIMGDSQNKFAMELDPKEVTIIQNFLKKLNDKIQSGELAWYDCPCIEFKLKETKK